MRWQILPHGLLLLFLTILVVGGCAASFEPRALEEVNFLDRAQTQSQDNIQVTAAVLSAEETEQVFGFPLYKKGIQPVWLEVENKDKEPTWFLPFGLDPDYFPPLEVTYPYHRAFQNEYNRQLDDYFRQHAMGMYIAPGSTRSGFVFTNLDLGTKIFNVDLVGDDNQPRTFTFFVEVPGLVADHRAVEFEKLYSASQIVTYDEGGFKKALENMPCCTTNEEGNEQYLPTNLVLVGEGDDLLRVLIRSGWNETAGGSPATSQQEKPTDIPHNSRYQPVPPLYYYGRPQDASFRDARSTGFGRNVLRLWLSPMRIEGQPVWVGLVNRELAQQKQSAKNQKLDLDEVRTFFLQDLWYSQGISKYGYVKGGGASPILHPRKAADGSFYLTDGYRLVLLISKKSIPLNEIVAMDWEIPPEE
ncbi:LssY C-terminal domain-containing protein [bacterium]|nr:LssY C-terminal domain-containing protein [bacterium]